VWLTRLRSLFTTRAANTSSIPCNDEHRLPDMRHFLHVLAVRRKFRSHWGNDLVSRVSWLFCRQYQHETRQVIRFAIVESVLFPPTSGSPEGLSNCSGYLRLIIQPTSVPAMKAAAHVVATVNTG